MRRRASGGLAILLGIAVELSGQVPVAIPSSLLFSGKIAWIRDWRGPTFWSADAGRSWNRRDMSDPALDGFVYMVSGNPRSQGLLITTGTRAVVVPPGSRPMVPCNQWPKVIGEEMSAGGEFPAGLAVSPLSDARFLAMGFQTVNGNQTHLFTSKGCRAPWRRVTSLPADFTVVYSDWTGHDVLLVSNECRMYVSRDSGARWTAAQFTPALCPPDRDNEKQASLQFLPDGTGFLGLEGGRLYRTDEGGLRWTLLSGRPAAEVGPWPTARDAGAAYFLNKLEGWQVTRDSRLLVTRSGGRKWEPWGAFEEISRLVAADGPKCFALAGDQLVPLQF